LAPSSDFVACIHLAIDGFGVARLPAAIAGEIAHRFILEFEAKSPLRARLRMKTVILLIRYNGWILYMASF